MSKKIVGFNLSETAQRQLDALGETYNLERSAVVEGLLRGASKAAAKRLEQRGPVIKAQSARSKDYSLADLLWPSDDTDVDKAALVVARSLMLAGDPQPSRRRVKPDVAEARMAAIFERADAQAQGASKAFFDQPQPVRKSDHVAQGWVAKVGGSDDE